MKSFAKKPLQWFNYNMNSLSSSVKEKLTKKYKDTDQDITPQKRTDINIRLDRVKVKQKNESRKQKYFSTETSAVWLQVRLRIF